jgi:hypothetical protein
MNWLRRILRSLGVNYRYRCAQCGWVGNGASWTDSSDKSRSHYALCPRCCTMIGKYTLKAARAPKADLWL